MFYNNQVEVYKTMLTRFEGFLEFLNHDFFERKNNNLPTKYISGKLEAFPINGEPFSLFIISDDISYPFLKVDFIKKKYTHISINDASLKQIKEITDDTFQKNIKYCNKQKKKIFRGKKFKNKINDYIEFLTAYHNISNELCNKYSNYSNIVADKVAFAMQEWFESDESLNMSLETEYIRTDDIAKTVLYFNDNGLETTNIMIGDIVSYKFCSMEGGK